MHAVIRDVRQPAVEVLPAMLGNLHIILSGTVQYHFADAPPVLAPPLSLIAPTSQAYRMALSVGTRLLAIGFLPLGWVRLVRAPALGLADRVIDGADIWGARACDTLLARLDASALDGSHIDLVEDFLRCPAWVRHDCDHACLPLVDRWLERSGALSVDALGQALDVSRRHLQRLTQDCYGLPPKALAMKYRALRAAAELTVHGEAGMAQALRPYADQAHMHRDFRRFVGWTPGSFLHEHQNIAAATIAGRRAAGAVRPLVLWS